MSDKYEEEDFEDDFESASSSTYSSKSSSFSSASSHTPAATSSASSSYEKEETAASRSNTVTSAAGDKKPTSAGSHSSSSSSDASTHKSSSASSSKSASQSASKTTSRTATASSHRTTTVETSHAVSSSAPPDSTTDTNATGTQKPSAATRKPPAKAAAKKRAASKKGATTKSRSLTQTHKREVEQIEPAPVPRNQEELDDMLAENEVLKEQILQQHTHMYKNQQAASTKGGTTTKSATATQESRKDASARVVQETLLQQRLAQMLRKEQKDLKAQRKNLEEQIKKYRKASKYRHHVEVAKKDIADLTDENRDLQLEVRCNEKLLVMNANVLQSGEGQQRLSEELRAQNALTQRSLEHAIRDCTDAERQRDGVKQRVEALREKHNEIKNNENGDNDYNTLQKLREDNRQLKTTISQLKQKLNASQKQAYLGAQSSPSDAERSYLEERIAHMKLELERVKQQKSNAPSPKKEGGATWLESGANSPIHPAKREAEKPKEAEAYRELEDAQPAYKPAENPGFDFLSEEPQPPPKDPFADDDLFGGGYGEPAPPPAEPAKDDVPDWLAGDDEGDAGEGMEEEPVEEEEVMDYIEEDEEEGEEQKEEEEKPAWLEF